VRILPSLGPSGAGKSLTLKAIAGLMKPDRGRIELPGGVGFDSEQGIDLTPQARNTGYVVQDLALFPHLSVAENIGFGLHGRPREEQRQRVAELVELLGLEGLESRLPGAISGGQQQRVALGRALAARPSLLLLDEPFSALDAPVRTALRREVARLRRQLGLTAVFVTHDLQEAYALADKIALYDAGSVVQYGARDEVFRRPVSVRAARLLDARNIIEGRVVARTEAFTEVQTPWFRARATADGSFEVGDAAALVVRPEHVILLRRDRPHANDLDTTLDVEIIEELASANSHRLYLRVVGEDGPAECVIEADVPAHPYEVIGVAESREWRVALTLSKTVAVRA
ncbi:MAG: ATP-binding cassette domain-containing protein, partial [Dehalococcoidia bacterium]|nr:ATP-binding cassette domain-containing protein [Dehalococcoidia bacterium]